MAALAHPLFQRAARLAEASVYESSPEESGGLRARRRWPYDVTFLIWNPLK